MDDSTQTISQRIKILPGAIKEYLKGDKWDNDFQSVFDKHSIDQVRSEKIKLELFLYLILMQNKEDLREQIKHVLTNLPSPVTNQMFNELMKSIPGDVKDIINSTFGSVKNSVPKNLPIEEVPAPPADSTDESKVGVNIEREREEDEIKETPERDSLLHGIENPNDSSDKFEKPISSKLSKSTGGYSGQDPYREPLE
ncbi:MAG: hypothetical protein MRY49_02430 [Candidatus Pacebacteria bacterium]|nr:hypothetical protein [Candidatus Paceibacterota bacterium]